MSSNSKPIVLLRLINSQEIIGRLVDTSDGIYTLENILTVFPTQSPTNPAAYALSFDVYSYAAPESTHNIYHHSILSMTPTVPPELEKAYISRTSGIDIVTAQSSLIATK